MSLVKSQIERSKPLGVSEDLALPAGIATETELRFYLPRALVTSATAGLAWRDIEQLRFPESDTKLLLARFAPKLKDHADLFRYARLRFITDYREVSRYEIEFKGRKELINGAKITRPVISAPIEITASDYRELSRFASAGAERKRRYDAPGWIIKGQVKHPVTAEIDVYQALTGAFAPLNPKQGLATVEIELSNTSLIKPLLKCTHSFKFLRGCVPLNFEHAELGKALSGSKLGAKGIDSKRLKVIEALERISKSTQHAKRP